jgi:hypothetical protein
MNDWSPKGAEELRRFAATNVGERNVPTDSDAHALASAGYAEVTKTADSSGDQYREIAGRFHGARALLERPGLSCRVVKQALRPLAFVDIRAFPRDVRRYFLEMIHLLHETEIPGSSLNEAAVIVRKLRGLTALLERYSDDTGAVATTTRVPDIAELYEPTDTVVL